MNKLSSLQALKTYKPQPLSAKAHLKLIQNLKLFRSDAKFTKLSYSHAFKISQHLLILEKMAKIGSVADEMDHHPEWTLKEGLLEINLSTHDIGNQISAKDYVLGFWIQKLIHQKPIAEQLISDWNSLNQNVSELN